MWTIIVFKALVLMIRTLPLVALRLLVFGGVAAGTAAFTFSGAWIGHGLGLAGATADPRIDALLGGLAGLALAATLIALRRDRLLHGVQALGLAAVGDLLDGKRLSIGPDQIGALRMSVASRFGTGVELLALTRLVAGITGLVPRVADGLGSVLTLPGFGRLASGGLVEQVILAQAYRARPENAWESAHDALVLYTQNARAVLSAAGWITLLGWFATGIVFVFLVGPLSGVAGLWPGAGQAGVLLVSALAAGAIRAAVIDPLAFACLLQGYLRISAGQDPLPEWRGRLTQFCDRFRQLGERAVSWAPGQEAQA
jgi:hypothetical protein